MLFLLLLTALPLISAANTFVGCTGTDGGSFRTVAGGNASPSSCAAACESQTRLQPPSTYSLYRASDSTCRCVFAPPGVNAYTPNIPPVFGGADQCNNPTDLSAYRLATTFSFNGCYQDSITSNDPAAFQRTSIDDCFVNCRTAPGLLFSVDSNSGNFNCLCTSSQTPGSVYDIPIGCAPNPGRFYAFSHPPEAAASGLLRRRRVAAYDRDDYCPGSLTACRVKGSVDGYECIDTASELESCGGCLHGVYGTKVKRSTARASGVNCAEISGGALGGMTCKRGKCVEEF